MILLQLEKISLLRCELWYSSVHIDVVGSAFDIWIDELKIMEDGKFLIEPTV
jgi:hypothetical protein